MINLPSTIRDTLEMYYITSDDRLNMARMGFLCIPLT